MTNRKRNLSAPLASWPWNPWLDVRDSFAFQINQQAPTSIADEKSQRSWSGRVFPGNHWWLEVLFVFATFAVLTTSITPGVNESHYLTKAKHYWNPDWCGDDVFLDSSDAHLFFFFTMGWPTRWLSLDTVAWIGRILCWWFAAVAWINLNRTLGVRKWFSIVSATMFTLLVDRFDMAGEWVIGGFEAKTVAYIFVISSLRQWLRGQLLLCLLSVGAAIAFHAVVGVWAWACLSAAYLGQVFLLRENSLNTRLVREPRFYIAVTGFVLLAAAGILPPLMANASTSAELVKLANHIQVHERLDHHLLFGKFQVSNVGRFTLMLAIYFVLFPFMSRIKDLRMIQWFSLASLAIAWGGLFLSGLAEQAGPQQEWANALLRFYWFRFSDFAVPLALALTAAFFGSHLMIQSQTRKLVVVASTVCLAIAALVAVLETFGDWRSGADRMTLPTYPDSHLRTQQTYDNWKKVCHWIRVNTRSDALFLTPPYYQTFKWHSHRAEFACWKDIPQDAQSIVQWRQRIALLQAIQANVVGGVLGLDEDTLANIIGENGVTHIVARQADEDLISKDWTQSKQLTLNRIYPIEANTQSTFVVYSVVANPSSIEPQPEQ